MSQETARALMTWLKFAAWAGVAAGVQALIDGLTTLDIGDSQWSTLFIVIVGACLKAAATWVATRARS